MFGPEAGHVEETDISMGWLLLMGLRYALFTRSLVYPHLGNKVDPERDPVIISPEDDPVGAGQHPDLFG